MKKILFIALMGVIATGLASCSKDNVEEYGTTTEDPNLTKAVKTFGFTVWVNEEIKKGRTPTSVTQGGETAYVHYFPNGTLDDVALSSFKSVFIYNQPLITVDKATSREIAVAARSKIKSGEYDYTGDPAKVIAFFGSFMGDGLFGNTHPALNELRDITNNSGITEEVYKKIKFPTNCYKLMVFGKNKTGALMGKYIGYATDEKSFNCICIDPESSSFGKPSTIKTSFAN